MLEIVWSCDIRNFVTLTSAFGIIRFLYVLALPFNKLLFNRKWYSLCIGRQSLVFAQHSKGAIVLICVVAHNTVEPETNWNKFVDVLDTDIYHGKQRFIHLHFFDSNAASLQHAKNKVRIDDEFSQNWFGQTCMKP